MKKLLNITNIVIVGIFIATLIILASMFKWSGTLEQQSKVGGPLESSGSTSRYALTEAIVEDGSVVLNQEQYEFAKPDVSLKDGKAFTVFAPGVSFIGAPFYAAGKSLGADVVASTLLSTFFFALLNILLVYKLARKLKASKISAVLSSLLFIFGTNALAYTFTFTQHHISTALLLLAILNAIQKRSLTSNIMFGFIASLALLVDIPNAIMLLPIGIYVLAKHFKTTEKSIKLKTNIIGLVSVVPLLIVFGIYNLATTGSYTEIAQMVGRIESESVAEEVAPKNELLEANKLDLPLNTRNQLNGFYILLLSDERGVLFYTPLLIVGLLGLAFAKKENKELVNLIGLLIGMNILIYASFGDVWGGWSFGSRYLVPVGAFLSAAIAVVVDKFNKNPFILFGISLLIAYSIAINVAGAITTTLIPPKVEAINLEVQIPHNFQYNFNLLNSGLNNSVAYDKLLSSFINESEFYYMLVGLIILITGTLVTAKAFDRKEDKI